MSKIFLAGFASFALAHYIFLRVDQYFHWPWLDSVMHLLGGIIIVFGLYTLREIRLMPPSWVRPGTVLLIVLAIAVAWEVFGYVWLHSYDRPDYVLDTTLDIVFGMLGGWVGLLLVRVVHATIPS